MDSIFTKYPDSLWRILMRDLHDHRSMTVITDVAHDCLQLYADKEHPQAKVLKLISSCNDLDVIHRTCANELGLTEKVKELDAWIARKPKRRFDVD